MSCVCVTSHNNNNNNNNNNTISIYIYIRGLSGFKRTGKSAGHFADNALKILRARLSSYFS